MSTIKKVAEKYGAGTEDYNKYSITYSDMAKTDDINYVAND